MDLVLKHFYVIRLKESWSYLTDILTEGYKVKRRKCVPTALS